MEEPRTICVKCKYHKREGKLPEVWNQHFCTKRENEEVTDPVTGKLEYETGQHYPHCRDLNVDGEGVNYEENKGWWQRGGGKRW